MNKINKMKKWMLIAVLIFTAGVSFGQSRIPSKVGYVDYALLRDTLPATDTFEYEIQLATYQFQQQILEYQKHMQEVQAELDTTTFPRLVDILKKDLATTNQKMQEEYQRAEYIIGQLQQKAVADLNLIISRAVQKVAKAKNYTIVLDSSSGSIVYGVAQDDLTQSVANVLRIKI